MKSCGTIKASKGGTFGIAYQKPREFVLQGRKWLISRWYAVSLAAHAKGRSPCKAYSAGFFFGATVRDTIVDAPMSVAALSKADALKLRGRRSDLSSGIAQNGQRHGDGSIGSRYERPTGRTMTARCDGLAFTA